MVFTVFGDKFQCFCPVFKYASFERKLLLVEIRSLTWPLKKICFSSMFYIIICPISLAAFWLNVKRLHRSVYIRIHPNTSVNNLYALDYELILSFSTYFSSHHSASALSCCHLSIQSDLDRLFLNTCFWVYSVLFPVLCTL